MSQLVSADFPTGDEAARPNTSAVSSPGRVSVEEALRAPFVNTLARLGLAALVAITFVSTLLIAVAHVDDRYNVNHVSGTWIALAQDVRDGTLYRPLFDDGFFGGTWYTPLQFVLQAGASFLTDDWIVSGKLLAYATALALLGLLYVLLRRLGCSRLISAALLSAVLLSQAGLFAATAIRGDMLPLVLQLAAVALVTRSISNRTLAIAALLCALAISAKLAAVWAPVAIVLWLAFRGRRPLAVFLGSFAGALVVVLGVFELASRGRMSETLIAVGGSGNSEASPFAGVPRLFDFLVRTTGPVWLLLPFLLVALVLAVSERRLSLYQLSLLVTLPLFAVVLADPGSDFNHLVDLVVLAVLCVGELWVRIETRPRELSALGLAIVLALLLGGANAYRQTMQSATADATKELLGRDTPGYPTEPLAGYVDSGDRILSEDPAVPVLLGQRPVLLDAVSVRRVGLDHPEWLADLEGRLDRAEFDKVVLVHPIEDNLWYGERNFGPSIQAAIRRDYELVARVDTRPLVYWVYAPRAS